MISQRHATRLLRLAQMPSLPKPPVGTTPADVVWTENKLRLLRYRPRAEGIAQRQPILVVPSLINRHYVLDLMPGKSLVAWLVAEGFDVYCVDWGTPGPEDAWLDLDAIVDGYLGRALRVVSRRSRAHSGDGKVHLLGYCMGGMFTAMLAARDPGRVASLVALAAPIRMAGDPGLLRAWASTSSLDVDGLVAATGLVPWQLLQSAFHMLRPTLQISRIVHLVDRAWRDEFLEGHAAMETWANDNVSLPGAFFSGYIGDIYRNDALARGTLTLGGETCSLSSIVAPTLAVIFRDDHIAPADSCRALLELISSETRECLELGGSHVGGVVSKAASKRLWPKLATFWHTCELSSV